MTKLEQGDVYFVEFGPSKGHEYEKSRPAIILTTHSNLKIQNIITCVPLSSRLDNRSPDDILINKDGLNNLFTDSIIKMRHLTACDPALRLRKYIGKVAPDTLREIKQILRRMFLL